MDFNLQWSDKYEHTVVHPITFKDTDCVITLCSPDSDTYQTALREYIQLVSNGMDVTEGTCLMLSKVIDSWVNVENDGEQVEFSEENANKLLIEQPWLREQLDRASSNRANFTKG